MLVLLVNGRDQAETTCLGGHSLVAGAGRRGPVVEGPRGSVSGTSEPRLRGAGLVQKGNRPHRIHLKDQLTPKHLYGP